MYSTCLFCSADLGTNEAIESFPVGRRVALDAWKGGLWGVCVGKALPGTRRMGQPWLDTAHGTERAGAGAPAPSVASSSRGAERTGPGPPSPGPRVESGSASSRRRA
jgi:hypothetical protein